MGQSTYFPMVKKWSKALLVGKRGWLPREPSRGALKWKAAHAKSCVVDIKKAREFKTHHLLVISLMSSSLFKTALNQKGMKFMNEKTADKRKQRRIYAG